MKNILLIAANSDIAKSLIELLEGNFQVFASYRKNLPDRKENFIPFVLDLCDDKTFFEAEKIFKNIKFDAVVNFAGVAVTSPVSRLNSDDLKFQFDVSVVGFARLLKFIYPYLNKESKVINISSMASFGIFPFISPYCAAKAASDILLNAFELETGINCVSIKPGVVKTKFWQYCIDLNENSFKNFDNEYEKTGKFLLENAKRNSNRGISSNDVARVILRVINSKNPKKSYLIGMDAWFASISKFVPAGILNKLIKYTLNKRVRNFSK